MAGEYARALAPPVRYEDVFFDPWYARKRRNRGMPEHSPQFLASVAQSHPLDGRGPGAY